MYSSKSLSSFAHCAALIELEFNEWDILTMANRGGESHVV